MQNPRNVAILVFDDVEVLDFAGPYEVFNVAGEVASPAPFYVYAVGISDRPVVARGRLVVAPRYSILDAPQASIVVIPGGYGTRPLLEHEKLAQWLREQADKAERLLSVCTGALLLARAGLLKDRAAATHHTAFDRLASLSPSTRIEKDKRFVRSTDRIVTSGGISAGIDMALHVVEELAGPEIHRLVVEEMEYNWGRKQRRLGRDGEEAST